MKIHAMFPRSGLLGIALLALTVVPAPFAQTTTDSPTARSATPDDLTPSELLKSYLQVREQLHNAQLAIVNNRVESESKARAQATAVAEKLEAIKTAIEAEREGHRMEAQRANAERERQRLEMENANRTVLWIAGAVGVAGLLALLVTPLIQWRTMNRITEIAAMRPQLPAPAGPGLLPAEAGAQLEQTVNGSNQRLLSVIDRMERRIFELEHTAGPTSAPVVVPAVATTTSTTNGSHESDPASRRAADQAAWIAVLLAKGQSLLTANKAKEAVACFDEIIKLDEKHTGALVKKGFALERLQQDESALDCYERAIELDPKLTLAYLYKGGVCNRLKRFDEAVDCYEMALKAEETGKRVAAVRV
jgi:tetratricopeptide (TPR) repeat protein